MTSTRLQDDLMQEFQATRQMIQNQLDLFDPMAGSLRRPAAQRILRKGVLIFWELLCYAAVLGSIAAAVFMNRLIPFYMLAELRQRGPAAGFNAYEANMLYWTVTGLILLSGLLLLVLARSLRRIRLKNDILSTAGRHIKTLVGQHLQRKAALEALEQRHFMDTALPAPPQPAQAGGSFRDIPFDSL